MTRLDRLVLSEIVPPFFGSLLLFIGLFMGADNLLKIFDYAGKGVPLPLLLQFFLFSLPPVIALTSPIAMLLATLLGFGRLSGDSEITALSAAGAPLVRIIAPVAGFAFLVTCAGIFINDTVVPLSERGRQAFINAQKQKAGQLFGGVGLTSRRTGSDGKLSLLIHSEGQLETIGAGRFRLTDVLIVRYVNGFPSDTTFAATAEGGDGDANWILYGVKLFGVYETGATYATSMPKFDGKRTELGTPESLLAGSRPNIELTTAQLGEKAQTLRVAGSLSDARAVEVEAARRVMVPLGSLIFALVGAPLGITPNRASKGVGFGYSVGITFLYWVTLQFASVLGTNGTLPPVLAVALPNIAGIALGVYLIVQMRR